MSLFSVVAVFFFAVLSGLLWSYGLQIITRTIKLLIVAIIKVTAVIVFGRKKNIKETVVEADKKKGKTP